LQQPFEKSLSDCRKKRDVLDKLSKKTNDPQTSRQIDQYRQSLVDADGILLYAEESINVAGKMKDLTEELSLNADVIFDNEEGIRTRLSDERDFYNQISIRFSEALRGRAQNKNQQNLSTICAWYQPMLNAYRDLYNLMIEFFYEQVKEVLRSDKSSDDTKRELEDIF